MASARSANANKSLLLITLMILMTQVGYLENLNPWINGEQTLDETDDVIETGGSGSSNTLTPSTEGASVLLGDTMIPITFEYDAAIANRQLLSNNLGISDQLSCAILENGSVACWGYNQYGQSGNSSSTSTFSSTPELTDTMPGNQKAVALDTSKYTGCALLENGSVACWGWTWGYGEMGDGTQTMGVRAPGLTGSFGSHRSAVEVSTANQGACVLLDNGSVSCWGEGSKGTIGDGITTDYRSSPTPTASLPNGKKAVALTSGHTHHCALLEDGNVACWGSNSQGQLGDNSTTNRNTPTLTQPLGAPAIAIESDYAHTCALLSNGSVVCWGDNAYGQIGNGASGGDILTPTFVSNITGTVVSITTSVANTCALLYNNSVMCWGDNTHGQIGNGTTSSGTTPDYTSSFATNQTKLMLDGGGNGSCALVDNGSMHCWGENSKGSIGDGTTNDADTPTLVDTSMTFLTTHITELTSASACSTTPSLPTGLSIDSSTCTISGVPTAAVDNRTYIVTATVNGITFQNSIWLSTAYRNMTPSVDGADVYVGVDMQDISFETSDIGSSSLAMTFQSTCAIINNGTVKCWGNSANGRLGNGASGSVGSNSNDMGDALPVTNLGTGRTATALSSAYKQNYAHTCAVLDDGTVKCWGVNSNGQLGIGSTTSVGSSLDDMGDNLSAVDLGGGRTAVDIATGVGFTCALLDTGAVKCWGANGNGQLGIGNTTQMGDHTGEMGDNLSTVDLGTGRTAVAVAAGYHHACAILDNGSVKCWGFNNAGQLGHSSTVRAGNDSSNMGDALPFTPLAQGRTAVHIDAGSAHTCVVFDNGSVQCWGSNTKGQLGLGTSSNMGDNTGEMGSHLPFVDLGTGRTAVDLTTMEESTCAVLDNGSVKCWGRNDHGQLGQGVSTQKIGHAANQMGDNLAVTNLGTGGAEAIAIGSGFSHACAVFDNGSLKCWGSNGNPSGSFHGWLGFPSSVATVGRSAGDMGDNLPFVNLGTNVGMNGTSFTSCVASPNLPTGVSIDTSTCSISGAPTVESTNQTYTVTGLKNGKYYQGSFWLSSSYIELTPSVEGADLIIDEAMENITFQYNASAASGSGGSSGSGSNSGTYNGNGTAWMVENIANGGTSSFPEKLAAVGNTLFFRANNGQVGFELWKSNGTSSGTVMVKNINSGSGSQASSNPNYLTEMGNTLYFSAMDTTNNGHQLWKSDGTASGTVMVTAINSGGTANPGIHTDGLVVMNNNLYFSANDGTNGVELWKSDGTASGTVMVKDINPGSGESFSYTPAVKPVVMNNELYFQAKDGTNGFELWKSDGTASGTVMVKDIYSGSSDSYPSHLTVVGNTLYFTANDGTNGYELWKSDGTASGTVMVKDIHSGGSGGSLNYLTAVGNTLYFSADDGTNGAELWKSDGTASGTVMVKDIYSGSSSSPLFQLTAVGNTLYFRATDGSNGRELWKSDGTASGTVMVKDINSGSGSSSPFQLTAIGNTLYFRASDGTNGAELWKSDGTASGTVMVQDIYSGSSGSDLNEFTVVGNTLYFTANDGTHANELWALDPANITGLSSGSGSGSSGGMTNVTGATSCTASPNLPTGLNIDSSTCTISGTPTVEAVNATYEINATIGGVTYIGSVWLSAAPFGTITSAVDGAALNLGEAMTPIALNYTSQAPPGSSGNGTVWTPTPPSGTSTSPRMGDYFMLEHDDVIYFDAMMSNGKKAVYAFSTVNGTMWNTYDISSITSATSFQPYTGNLLAQFVGDDLFFTVKNSTSGSIYELWVYSTSNGTTWRAMQQTASTYGLTMEFVIGDRLYFDEHAWTGGSGTTPFIGVYDTSNHSYWNYSTTMLNYGIGSCPAPGANFHAVVGDTIYFDACDASQSYGNEMYAFNTVNGSYWRVTDLDNGTNHSWPGKKMHIVINDTIYFDAQVGNPGTMNAHALWAYNTSNGTTWLAADLREPGFHMKPHSLASATLWRKPVVIGDTMYFDASTSPWTARTSIGSTCTAGHTEIYAYNIGNQTAWCVADAGGPGWSGSGHNSDAAHNMLYLVGDVLVFDAATGSTGPGTSDRMHSLWAHNLSNGSTWEISTVTTQSDKLQEVGNGFDAFSINNALYFPAKNNTVGSEIWGYDIVNQTYWLANHTCPGWCAGISGGGFHTLVHQGVFYSSVRISQNGIGEEYILGVFNPVPSSPTSSGGSGGGSSGGSSGVTWSTHPALPAGMSLSSGVISGTPAVYALNQTYTIYANQSGYSTTHELYFSVDTDNAHTVVENQTIDPIGFHPPFSDGTTTWTVSPNLPASLTNSSTTGEITGTVTSTTTNATYTVTATHSDGSTETFTFNLQSLADYDGDGLANDLPSDYDAAEGPTPGLVADTDDDADGLLDTVETNTGTYVDSSNTGTDPLNPDTDGDGICDGPNAVSGVCVSGPDITNGGTVVDTPIVLLNNSDAGEIAPFYPVTGATYGLSPDLPTSMQFDSSNGSIWGAPDMLKTNTTYTMWANLTDGTTTSWTFFLEVLEDLDGDGMPDVLPGDYDAVNDPIRTPGLEEDLDDDGDGYNDTAETNTGLYLNGDNTGTDPRDPDTDDDGICDGPGTVAGVCTAGPDLTPFGPTATVVAVNNTMIPSVPPYYAGSGLTYGYSPDLPNGLTIDPNNGYLMGIPTETTGNITYTIYANDTNGDTYSWDFTIEVLEDSDGDGSPDSLPSDYDGDNDSIRAPPGLTEDLDDDGDGASDLDEIANGTEPLNPDTDGDGLCDGINAVPGVCFAGPDPYPNDPTMPIDTDGDGLPDDDSGWTGPPYADDDDDNDGYSDVSEDACGSDSLDASSIPADMDGDAICDGDDPDMDGDGIENVNETGDTTVPPGSSPINPDTDGDGICDGPESPVTSDCAAGPDMFPLDPSAWEDTDGDGYPNELFPPSTSVPPLEEDTDDDNDGWSDIDEVSCGSDPVDGTDVPVDENGDGICDVLDLDWDDDGIPNTNETDTGVYVDSSDTGTDPWNPDTDGDGFCDGPFAVMNGSEMICAAGPDPFPHDPTLPMDTDGDGLPNELPEDYIGNLVADDDDDNDGYTDATEDTCGSDSLDNLSMPTDLDGDTICDGDDLDMDGDGILNDAEDATDSITSSSNADTDGDGVCDGPSAPAMPAGICTAGADAFPDDPAAWDDTDGDGDPDEIVDGMTTDLVLDTDDDDDGWEDADELDCETNSKDNMSTPFDGDDDGICDVLDTQTLGYAIYGNESDVFEAYVNQSDFVLTPNLTGMEPGTWTIEPALPDGLSFSGTARSGETGIISGIPTEASPMQNYTVTADNGRVNKSFTFGLAVLNDFDGDRIPDEESVTGLETDPDDDNDGHLDEIELKCGSDPLNQTSVPDVDEEGNCIEGRYAEDDSDDGTGVLLWCLPLVILLLVLLLLIPLLIGDKVALMGPEPENTTSSPAFMSGNGTKADPFVLRPIKKLKAGSRAESKEAISITNMSPEILVDLLDLAESSNDKRFMMYEIDGSSEESGYKLEADEEGRLRLRFVFDDGANPTYPGAEYEGLLKLGKASVYVSWTVEVKEDKRKMNQIRKEQEAAEKAEKEAKEAQEKAKAEAEAKEAEEKAEAEAKAAEEKAAKEAEKKAKAEEKAAAAALAKKEKEEAAAKKKEEAAAKKAKAAEEKAAKEAEEVEAKAKAEAEAKAAEEKAAKEAEKKAKAEEKAAAAAKKAKEEEEAKKKAEAEAKAAEEKAAKEAEKKAKAEEKAAAAAAKKAKEEEEAKKKADADAKAAAKKVEKKPAAAKEAKKQEELQRVKKRAKSIDFKVIGEASSSELKSEVKKGATTLEVANAKDFAESGSAEINDAKGSNVIAWTGKDGNTLTGVSGVTRVFAAKAVLMVKDDLQVIKGIGPFIEEKLNALGITTYRQLANMTAKLETQVNEAIEFFPGRVKRDQWVAQAKILLGMDAKLDEKALKQAEELERVAQKAEGIDFAVLGVASASEADDLQKIKGIGPFIAEKLNALGIYKFSQLANMTSEIEEEVNVAIEFFPGRVKRDEWAKQAKELAKD